MEKIGEKRWSPGKRLETEQVEIDVAPQDPTPQGDQRKPLHPQHKKLTHAESPANTHSRRIITCCMQVGSVDRIIQMPL